MFKWFTSRDTWKRSELYVQVIYVTRHAKKIWSIFKWFTSRDTWKRSELYVQVNYVARHLKKVWTIIMFKWFTSHDTWKRSELYVQVNYVTRHLKKIWTICSSDLCHAIRDVMVSMCAGSNLGWGLNFRALVPDIFWSSSSGIFFVYSGFPLPSSDKGLANKIK